MGAKYASEDFICTIDRSPGASKHHLYSQKTRPDLKNEEWNMIPVMQKHHNMFHNKGNSYMAKQHFAVKAWLLNNGWEFDEYAKKWRHKNAALHS